MPDQQPQAHLGYWVPCCLLSSRFNEHMLHARPPHLVRAALDLVLAAAAAKRGLEIRRAQRRLPRQPPACGGKRGKRVGSCIAWQQKRRRPSSCAVGMAQQTLPHGIAVQP